MSIFNKKKKKIIEKKNKYQDPNIDNYELSKKASKNINLIHLLFKDNDNLILRKIVNNHDSKVECHIAFINGMVDSKIINDSIIKPFTIFKFNNQNNLLEKIATEVIYTNEIKVTDNIREIIEAITSGDSILLLDGWSKVIIMNTRGYVIRAITEPEVEKILSGPREGFNESLLVNISLLHRKFRTNQLKTKYISLGKQTNTNVCVCYIESVVNKDVLNDLYKKLQGIDIDAILDSNYITELINDKKYSPFKKIGITERPDVVVGKLLEGRVAILVDGSPVALTVPHLFIENFQSAEDYYLNPDYASISRVIRVIGFFLTICVPSLYIAIVAFHQEMIPTSLFINIAMERQSAPFPAGLEVVIMLIIFEILKETGIRMPTTIGQALSIVGALVIGQAAVEAELVAAPMIIVVGITGISSLLVPKLNSSVIIYRFLTLFLTIIIGFLGFILGLSILLIHILNLKSFNIFQVKPLEYLNPQNSKDTFVRKSWKDMITRPKKLSNNYIRQDEEKVSE